MILTNDQENAINICKRNFNYRVPYTIITGYAGSGKSTLIPFIISALNLDPRTEVAYISYTGKAALVMASKGCYGAMTSHRLLYDTVPLPNGGFRHIPKKYIGGYKLVIVDEVSMLPKEIWELLLTHKIPVIAFGDPGQLPPVKSEDNGMLDHPDYFISEIVRQAQDNEIIRLSMDIRQQKPLSKYKGEQIQIIDPSDVISGMYVWADQIICAKNATRKAINQDTRKLLYNVEDTVPIEGDKVICLTNYWDEVNGICDPLVNGTTGTISYIRTYEEKKFHPALKFDLLPDGFEINNPTGDPYYNNIFADYKLLTTGEPTITIENWTQFKNDKRPREFDYGYAITCWKAQGSEYDKILVFEEDFPFNAEEHQRFLYTAVTRARQKLVLVRKN